MEHKQRLKLYISEKALAVVCGLVFSFILVLTLLGAFPGLAYTPKRKAGFLLCAAALMILALLTGARKGRWLFLTLLMTLSVLRLFIPADGMGPWLCALALLDLILGGILFARAKAGRKLRLTVGTLCVLLLIPTLSLMLFTAVIGNDGMTLRRYPAPNGTYEAEVRVADGGATGGSTTITILQSWPFGPLNVVLAKTRMGWIDPGALDVEWTDDETLSINGKPWRWRETR